MFEVSRVGNQSAETAGISVLRTIPSPFGTSASGSAKYVLAFDTGPLTPIGATVFRITQSTSRVEAVDRSYSDRLGNQSSGSAIDLRSLRSYMNDDDDDPQEVVVSNDFLTVRFDRYVFEKSEACWYFSSTAGKPDSQHADI